VIAVNDEGRAEGMMATELRAGSCKGAGRHTLGLVLASWLVSATSFAAPAAGGGISSEEAEVPGPSAVPGLRIWIEPTVPEGERIRGWVEERARAVLTERMRPIEPEDVIRVAVRGGPYDYRIHIALVRNKRLLEEQMDVLVCECGSDEMLVRVGEAIRAGAERIEQAADVERAAAAQIAAEEHAEWRRQEHDPPDAPSKTWRHSALGVVGVVVAALGVTTFGGGIAMVAVGRAPVRDRSNLQRDWRPPGVAALVVGGTALAAGVTMTVVDLVKCRQEPSPSRCERERDDDRRRRVGVAPSIEGDGGGLTVTGRF
jgi:hypothetical protein